MNAEKDGLRILIATDGSAEAAEACRFVRALPLAGRSTIHVLSVVKDQVFREDYAYWTTRDRFLQYEHERAAAAVREAAELLASGDTTVTTAVPSGIPAREILLAAEEFAADLVVVGPKGHSGLEDFLVGSVARTVAQCCGRPVLVARAPHHDIRRVILAVDASEHAQRAAKFAARLPLRDETEWTIVHVVRPQKSLLDFLHANRAEPEAAVAEARRRQEEAGARIAMGARESLAAVGKPAQTELRVGDPGTEILRLAGERAADLLIVGARGASLIEGLLIGSVADRMLRDARCSVLIVH